MSLNKSLLILLIFLVIGFIVRLVSRKKKKKKFGLGDYFNVLFNMLLVAGGIISLYVSLFNVIPFGEELIISLPVIEFVAGITLVVIGIWELWGGNNES